MIVEKFYDSAEFTAEIFPQAFPSIKGIITDGLAISTSYSYEDLFDLNKQHELSKLFDKIKSLTGFTQSSLMRIEQTIKYWLGGGISELNIMLLIPNLRQGFLKKEIDKINQFAFPKQEGVNIYAPHDYSPSIVSANDNSKGLIGLRYSTYFRTTRPVFVLSSLSIKMSSVIMEDGYPAFAEVNIGLTPYRMLTRDDIKGSWL